MKYSYEFIIKAIKAVEDESNKKLVGFTEITGASIIDMSYNHDIITSATIEVQLKQYARSERYLKVYVRIYNDVVSVGYFDIIQ